MTDRENNTAKLLTTQGGRGRAGEAIAMAMMMMMGITGKSIIISSEWKYDIQENRNGAALLYRRECNVTTL